MYVMVNKEQVLSELKLCDDSILMMKEERKKLSTLLGNISEVWKGKDADAFVSKMSYFIEDIKSFENQLASYDKFVTGYINAEKQLDKHYRTREIKVE